MTFRNLQSERGTRDQITFQYTYNANDSEVAKGKVLSSLKTEVTAIPHFPIFHKNCDYKTCSNETFLIILNKAGLVS